MLSENVVASRDMHSKIICGLKLSNGQMHLHSHLMILCAPIKKVSITLILIQEARRIIVQHCDHSL